MLNDCDAGDYENMTLLHRSVIEQDKLMVERLLLQGSWNPGLAGWDWYLAGKLNTDPVLHPTAPGSNPQTMDSSGWSVEPRPDAGIGI